MKMFGAAEISVEGRGAGHPTGKIKKPSRAAKPLTVFWAYTSRGRAGHSVEDLGVGWEGIWNLGLAGPRNSQEIEHDPQCGEAADGFLGVYSRGGRVERFSEFDGGLQVFAVGVKAKWIMRCWGGGVVRRKDFRNSVVVSKFSPPK